MRHKKKVVKLSREKGPRKALLRSLVTNLVLRDKIKTTEAKAKALRSVIEKYITVGQEKNLTNRRRLLKFFYNEKAVNKILDELGPKYKDRRGGYTRVIKLGVRKGDGAEMALIEFV